ncbi:MAG: hypothetical protein RIR11_4607 [Bacteroidota bacterium]
MTKIIHLLLLLFAITPYISKAQGCEALIKDARTLAKNLKFDEAVKKVEAAKGCAAQADIDKLYSEIFAGLKKQTIDANKAKERVEKAEKDTRITLSDRQKALASVVRLTLKEADKKIYVLDYEGALEIMKNAATLQAAQKEVSDALLEIVFFFAETERFDRAKGVLDTAAQLAGRPFSSPANGWKKRTDFRRAIKSLNPERDTFLAARYFPVMLPIPGGTDTIGKGEERHAVTLSPFKMAKTETTWWQYNLFCEATKKRTPKKPKWGSDGDNPVVYVSWYDAVEYANWLSEREGRRTAMRISGSGDDDYEIILLSNSYRLPTEAEWEYAARARSPFEYAGSSDLDSVAWYDDNSDSRSHPVAEKKANAFGLYDMSGNVWEWCWDWYAEYNKNEILNPKGVEKGVKRINRGGSWRYVMEDCNVRYRYYFPPVTSTYALGFRLSLQ